MLVERLSRRQRLTDLAVAALLALVGVLEIWVPFESLMGDGSRVLSTIGVLWYAAHLSQRRTRPWVALAGLLVWPLLGTVVGAQDMHLLFFGQLVPTLVLTFTVARHGTGRYRWVGTLGVVAFVTLADLFVPLLRTPSELLYHWGNLTIVYLVGHGLRVSADRAAREAVRAHEAESRVRERELAAIADERARIARELHDIVAHAMSVMVVQAGAAEQLTEDDPVRVRKSLSAIRSTGTEALGEMRRLVGMLRDDSDVGLLAPQPGLSGLKALVDEASETGLPVTLEVSGDERDLPAGVDLAAYRIVQEALTNARRHAVGASQVSVAIRFEPERLELEVADDGRASADTTGSGHGLVGMRERVALYDGTLAAERLADGGFRVLARLPLAPVQGMAL